VHPEQIDRPIAEAGSELATFEAPAGVDPVQRGDEPLRAVEKLLSAQAKSDGVLRRKVVLEIDEKLVNVELVGVDEARAALAVVFHRTLDLPENADVAAEVEVSVGQEADEVITVVVLGRARRRGRVEVEVVEVLVPVACLPAQ
jgi:hypothetical protein